ncbi:hypothetical protein [Mesorhizobium sp.]|uniref:hypothetical protein n=1 Tax=Mesorhizobium sp. TaxID=1871066 RepID=UPI00257945C5|nr:hypothetical protein [Mesorhizobium sp.]
MKRSASASRGGVCRSTLASFLKRVPIACFLSMGSNSDIQRAAFQEIFATRFKSLFMHVAAPKPLPRHAWI